MRKTFIPAVLAVVVVSGCASDPERPTSAVGDDAPAAQTEAPSPPVGTTLAHVGDAQINSADELPGIALIKTEGDDDGRDYTLLHQDGSTVPLVLDAFDDFDQVDLGGEILLVAGSLEGEYGVQGLSSSTLAPLYTIPFERSDDGVHHFFGTSEYVVTYTFEDWNPEDGCVNVAVYDVATGEPVDWPLPAGTQGYCPMSGTASGLLTLGAEGSEGVTIDVATGTLVDPDSADASPGQYSTERGGEIEYGRGDVHWTFDAPAGGTGIAGVAHGVVVADSNGNIFTLLDEETGEVLSTYDARALGNDEGCDFVGLLSTERLLLRCGGDYWRDIYLIAV